MKTLLLFALLSGTAIAAEPVKPSREDSLELENIALKLDNLQRAYGELTKRRGELLDKYGLMVDEKGQVAKKPDPKKEAPKK